MKNRFAGYSSLPRSTMSEPLGCSDHFCQESAIPCLETVSEEARRHTGNVKQTEPLLCSIRNLKFKFKFLFTQPDWMVTIYPIIIFEIHLSIHHRKVDSQTTIVAEDQNAYIKTIRPSTMHHRIVCITIIMETIQTVPPSIIIQMP